MTDLNDIDEIFKLFDDWEQRYQYLVELGEQIPLMPDELKTDENKVNGCMSQVWVHAYSSQRHPQQIHFYGDSDTGVIKGVLALLIQLVEARSDAEIQKLDMDEIFERLNLAEHLSPNRHIGIYAIFEKMKAQSSKLRIAA